MAPVAGSFDEVDRFAAEVRADDAARSRALRAELARQAAEEATLAGVLTDLGERGATVVLHLVPGRSVAGLVQRVGADFVGLVGDDGTEVLVALAAVGSVRTLAGERPVAGGRCAPSDLTFTEALGWLAADRPRVHVRAGGADPVAGVLHSVGADVATVQVEGGAGGLAYVPLGTVTEVRLD